MKQFLLSIFILSFAGIVHSGNLSSLEPVCLSVNCQNFKEQLPASEMQCVTINVDDYVRALDTNIQEAVNGWRINLHSYPRKENIRGETRSHSGKQGYRVKWQTPPIKHGAMDKYWYINDMNSNDIAAACEFYHENRMRRSNHGSSDGVCRSSECQFEFAPGGHVVHRRTVETGFRCQLLSYFEREGNELKGYCKSCVRGLRDAMDEDLDFDAPDYWENFETQERGLPSPKKIPIEKMWDEIIEQRETLIWRGGLIARWNFASTDITSTGLTVIDDFRQTEADLAVENYFAQRGRRSNFLSTSVPASDFSIQVTGHSSKTNGELLLSSTAKARLAAMSVGVYFENKRLKDANEMIGNAVSRGGRELIAFLGEQDLFQSTLANLAGAHKKRPLLFIEYFPEWFELTNLHGEKDNFLASLTPQQRAALPPDDRHSRWPGKLNVCYHNIDRQSPQEYCMSNNPDISLRFEGWEGDLTCNDGVDNDGDGLCDGLEPECNRTVSDVAGVADQDAIFTRSENKLPAVTNQEMALANANRLNLENFMLPTGRVENPNALTVVRKELFRVPRINDKRIDWCKHWGKECGKPAADSFCQQKGFTESDSFQLAKNIGKSEPTWVIGDNRMCTTDGCGALAYVTCEGDKPQSYDAAPYSATTATTFKQRSEGCMSYAMKNVAVDYEGNKNWSASRINRLCEKNQNSVEPVVCFKKVMFGNISWGDGTRWNPDNAINLCQGTTNATERVTCFSQQINKGMSWNEAINACKQ